ncbi:glycoside hydrolase family 13 protein [Clostridium grantii]|uniref:Oligo-1,6-glucosidase n=1 Tax=Clostridium grantii DSM 8605 TaxID=1121316 RepID=A0A1M5UYL4_9CLOT|nr:alpha-glucosidase [Clostridium grantii]SHH68016.1 oligo-1,6-glucosidase [Clostridium grantii DSM 8605]
MKKAWWKESVVYQIYPRSFMDSNGDGVGDLKGIIQKLDYLKNLGIDIIWISPIYKSPNDDNGYDISDYRDIMDDFGTMDDFHQLLKEAHDRGLKIMMDLVVNHSSDEHYWFKESRKSKDNPYRDYYIWKKGKDSLIDELYQKEYIYEEKQLSKGIELEPPTNWEACFSGSAWQYDEATKEYYLHLFSKKQPDLNWENEKLRKEVYDMMHFWLKKGVDGFRMDVITFISKDQSYGEGIIREGKKYGDGSRFYVSGPRVHEFLREMNEEVLSKYNLVTVGEAPGVGVEDAYNYVGEDREELNMLFQFEHVEIGGGEKGKWSNKPWKLSELKGILTKWQKGLENKGWNSLYWNNHDQPRAVSRFGNDKEFRIESAKMLGTCLHMMQGTPYIYQGEELGMTNVAFESIEDYKDIEIINYYNEEINNYGSDAKDILKSIYARGRDNARTPMQWDDSENAGFTKGNPWININENYKEINSKESLNNQDSIYYYYQKLIKLRKENKIIVYGSYDLILPEHEKIFAFTRTFENQKLVVVCNFSCEQVEFELPENINYKEKNLLIQNYNANKEKEKEKDKDNGNGENQDCIEKFELKPYEARVYILEI